MEVPITDSDNAKWVYWKMDIDSFVEPGSYLVELRATSVDANGEEHTNGKIPNFPDKRPVTNAAAAPPKHDGAAHFGKVNDS